MPSAVVTLDACVDGLAVNKELEGVVVVDEHAVGHVDVRVGVGDRRSLLGGVVGLEPELDGEVGGREGVDGVGDGVAVDGAVALESALGRLDGLGRRRRGAVWEDGGLELVGGSVRSKAALAVVKGPAGDERVGLRGGASVRADLGEPADGVVVALVGEGDGDGALWDGAARDGETKGVLSSGALALPASAGGKVEVGELGGVEETKAVDKDTLLDCVVRGGAEVGVRKVTPSVGGIVSVDATDVLEVLVVDGAETGILGGRGLCDNVSVDTEREELVSGHVRVVTRVVVLGEVDRPERGVLGSGINVESVGGRVAVVEEKITKADVAVGSGGFLVTFEGHVAVDGEDDFVLGDAHGDGEELVRAGGTDKLHIDTIVEGVLLVDPGAGSALGLRGVDGDV
eukprot:comp21750_c0_seq1/m.48599 comp21750_c0_seq1/g.48599  ORF comp21750_c0_seq1/g.48599 comp21750_c0_seq1/m.48599 type:complete len:400 (+) comp21750_c0_seq1:1540-2739(+)